jgi:hypothetical protein
MSITVEGDIRGIQWTHAAGLVFNPASRRWTSSPPLPLQIKPLSRITIGGL